MTRPTVHTQGGLQADTLHLSAADSAAGARTVGAAGSARETAAIGDRRLGKLFMLLHPTLSLSILKATMKICL